MSVGLVRRACAFCGATSLRQVFSAARKKRSGTGLRRSTKAIGRPGLRSVAQLAYPETGMIMMRQGFSGPHMAVNSSSGRNPAAS